MKHVFLIGLCICLSFSLYAQELQQFSRQEAETIFLENNLLLIAEKLQIEAQQAEVIQAKLWPNPEFSIGEINLWKNSSVEPSPPFLGNFGRNQQVSFEINQLIQTAGKHKKLIALEQVDVAKAEQYFEDLLRGLKLELRHQLTDLQYLQQSIKVHQNLLDNIVVLTHAYKNQLGQGHISKAEYIRLKAQELEINKEILELRQESYAVQKELKILLRLDPAISITITDTDLPTTDMTKYQTALNIQMTENVKENRPDYKLALLEEEYSNTLLAYEKAQRTPDVTFGVNYDRNGSTMLDFVGIGISFDLPVFNRNKGGIKKALIGIDHAKIQREQKELTIENEVRLSYQSLLQAIDFLENIDAEHEEDLEVLLDNYTKNFASKNISMLEYIDFIDAYLNNKTIILSARKEVQHKAEELNYSLGTDIQ